MHCCQGCWVHRCHFPCQGPGELYVSPAAAELVLGGVPPVGAGSSVLLCFLKPLVTGSTCQCWGKGLFLLPPPSLLTVVWARPPPLCQQSHRPGCHHPCSTGSHVSWAVLTTCASHCVRIHNLDCCCSGRVVGASPLVPLLTGG